MIVGAMSSECKLCILMGKMATSTSQGRQRGRHEQQSMMLVPMDAAGLRVLRPLSVFGFDDAPRQLSLTVVS